MKGDHRLKKYLGLKKNREFEIFESDKTPTKESHPQFDSIEGPFNSSDEAENFKIALISISASRSRRCGGFSACRQAHRRKSGSCR